MLADTLSSEAQAKKSGAAPAWRGRLIWRRPKAEPNPDIVPTAAGMRFGSWTTLRRTGIRNGSQTAWLCRCDCGTEKEVVAQRMRSGRSKSCGCRSWKAEF